MSDTVLISGASRGIGLALVQGFIADGHHVIATCRQPDAAMALREIERRNATAGRLEIHHLDVVDDKSVQRLQASLAGRCVDLLINNAGIMGGERQSYDDMDYQAWAEAFAVNSMAPLRLSVAVLPNLRLSAKPRIMTLSSQMGALSRQSKGSLAYRSSKAAVNKVMQVLSLELAGEGVVVCPVHPGWVRTDMGGAQADISVADSAAGLITLAGRLRLEHSGRFFTWEGNEHEW